jgi:hypothetical protein
MVSGMDRKGLLPIGIPYSARDTGKLAVGWIDRDI